jgi:hypothetical protein
MVSVSPSHLKAMHKLVQRASETMKEMWIQDCMTSFGWSDVDARHIINEVRRQAKRELNATD